MTAGLALAAVSIGLPLVTGRTHFAAFLAGLWIGLFLLFWQYFLQGQGVSQRQIGGEAETWTATELAKLDRRTWRTFHDVPVAWGNVDHVVVGPGRVYAVETKWTGSRGSERFLRPAASQAERQAKRLEQRLAEAGCRRHVVPLLVVWGGGVADAFGEQPKKWGDTRVVAGHHSEVWLQRIRDASDRFELDGPVLRALEQLIIDGEAVDRRARG